MMTTRLWVQGALSALAFILTVAGADTHGALGMVAPASADEIDEWRGSDGGIRFALGTNRIETRANQVAYLALGSLQRIRDVDFEVRVRATSAVQSGETGVDLAPPRIAVAAAPEAEPPPANPNLRWSAAPHEGESARAAIGCSNGTNDDDWTCLVVRCEDDGSLGLYYEFSTGGTNDPFTIAVDGEAFPVTLGELPSGVPYQKRLLGDVRSIAEALRGGSLARIVDIAPPLNPGFDSIPLRGSSRAIGKIVAACVGKAGGASGGKLLRDAAGRVSIGNLTDQMDCASADGSGTVDEVSRNDRNGQIEGFWFVNDKYGREFINVEWLAPGKDFKARAATLGYLLTPGQRLDVHVLGCGAAGRVQELVAARERVDTSGEAGVAATSGDEGTSQGHIEGELAYPSDFIPDDLKVCAERLDATDVICTSEHRRTGPGANDLGYRLTVPAGAYHVYATFPPGSPDGAGYGVGYRAYYSQHGLCGHLASCPSHAPVVVTVEAGRTVGEITPSDWYDATQTAR